MKAVTYHRYGGPEQLSLVDMEPPTPGAGDVLVRVRASSLNSADDRLLRASPFLVRLQIGLLRPRRQVPGLDVAGVVEDVGVGVTAFRPGDRVFGENASDRPGTFAELAAVPAHCLAPLPDGLDDGSAAALPLAGVTALQAVRDAARVADGQRVLVAGAGGGVGMFLVQIAKARGAHITAVCGPGSVDTVRSLGADRVLDYSEVDLKDLDERFDAVFGVNGYHPLATYKRLLRPGGVYVMVGGSNRQIFEALLLGKLAFLFSGRRMKVHTVDASKRAADLRELAGLVAGGLRAVIDRRYPLEQTADALRYLEAGHVRGKVVITVAGT